MRLMSASIAATALMTAVRAAISPRMACCSFAGFEGLIDERGSERAREPDPEYNGQPPDLIFQGHALSDQLLARVAPADRRRGFSASDMAGASPRLGGVSLETDDEIRRACDERGMELQDLDRRLDAFGWEDRWDNFAGPQARAHHLLKSLDLGPTNSPLRRAGAIFFEEFGGGPGNGYTWVELEDDLTASLLQARLIELHLPINVEIGMQL
jgi:hypothetical protein